MALTRKLLKGMGLTEEQMDTIIEAHTDTVDGLKSDLARYKADAEKLPGVQAELENLKAKGDDGWKDKHDKVKKEFDDYKREQMQKETKSAKESAYRELLKSAGISEKRIDSVLKITDLSSVELEDGKIKNADDLKKSIKEEWADFVVTTKQKGAISTHAPAGGATAIFHKSVMRFCGKLPKDDTVLCLASFGFPRRDPKVVYLAWISCANLPQKCVREGLALKDQGTSCFHEGLASHAFDPVLV